MEGPEATSLLRRALISVAHSRFHTMLLRLERGHHANRVDVQPFRDAAHVTAREVDHQGDTASADLLDDEAIAFDQERLGDAVDAPDRIVLEGVHPGLVLDEGGPYSIQERRQAAQGLPVAGRVPDRAVFDPMVVPHITPAAAGDVESAIALSPRVSA